MATSLTALAWRTQPRPYLIRSDPKSVSEEEYTAFYAALAKKPAAVPLGYAHFKGDSGAGVSYRGLIYLPEDLPQSFWEKATETLRNVRLMVKRVFITDDLGPEFLPRWLAFLRVLVDGAWGGRGELLGVTHAYHCLASWASR